MPKKIEKRLRKYARKHHLKGEAANRYVYGGITNAAKRKRGIKVDPSKFARRRRGR